MLSIDMAQAHARDLLDASTAAYAVRSESARVRRRRARALAARLRHAPTR
jgi:hypothetical protein